MVDIPESPQRERNIKRYGYGDETAERCYVCGKPVETDKAPYIIVVQGGLHAATEAADVDEHDSGFMGWFPVGSGCVRKHPELKKAVAFAAKTP